MITMDGQARFFRKEGSGAAFRAEVTEEKIEGSTEYVIDGRQIAEHIVLNRHTGSIENSISDSSGGTLIHYGQCAKPPEH
jgi:hypothetical protein